MRPDELSPGEHLECGDHRTYPRKHQEAKRIPGDTVIIG
jgi:hypothetical protein